MRKLIIVAFVAIFICGLAPAQIKVVLVQDYEQMKANGTKQTNPTARKATVRKAAFNATETTDDEETIASDNMTNNTNVSETTTSTSKQAVVKGNALKANTANSTSATAAVEKKSTASSGSDYVKRLRERQKAARTGR
jgi:cytoskeletal protein RodZ